MVVDSNILVGEAVRANPEKGECPPHILREQCLLTVHYYGFDGELHRGQIVVHQDLTTDIHELFTLMQALKFPVAAVVPLAHPDYEWDREKTRHITYGFNYRTVHGSDRLSAHAHGRAIDINPLQNPYIRSGGKHDLHWPHVEWNADEPGTLLPKSVIVRFMESRGWKWGGHKHTLHEQGSVVDYMHFEKLHA